MELPPLPYAPGAVTACAFSVEAKLLVLGTTRGFIEIFSVNGAQQKVVQLFRHEVQTLAFCAKTNLLLAGSSRGEVATLHLETDERLALSQSGGSAHAFSAFDSTGARAAIIFSTMYHGHEGSTLHLIHRDNVTQHKLKKKICRKLFFVQETPQLLLDGKLYHLDQSLAYEAPGEILAFAEADQMALYARPQDGQEEIFFQRDGVERRLLRSITRQQYFISAQHQLLIAIEHLSNRGRVRCFSYLGELIREQEIDGFRFFFCAETAQLLACGLEEDATLYSLKEGRRGASLRRANLVTHSQAIFRRDESVALLSYEKAQGLLLHEKGKPTQVMPRSAGCNIGSLLVSQDASRAVLLDWAGEARTWDLTSGKYLGSYTFFQRDELHGVDLPPAIISFDGRFLASLGGKFRLLSLTKQHEVDTHDFRPISKEHAEAEDSLDEQDSWLPTTYRAKLLPGGRGAALYHTESGALQFVHATGERRRLIGRGVSGCFEIDLDWSWVALASTRQLKLLSLKSGDEFLLERPHNTKPIGLLFSPTAERVTLLSGRTNLRSAASKTSLELPSYDEDAISYHRNKRGELIPIHQMSVDVYSVINKTLVASLALEEPIELVGVSDNGERLYISVRGELRRYQRRGPSYLLQERARAIEGGAALWGKELTRVERGPDGLEGELSFAPQDRRELHIGPLVQSKAKLTQRELGGAQLDGASLAWASLQGADLRGASLRDAMLTGADLSRARLDSATLIGAKLTGARLEGASLFGADLRWADVPTKALNTATGALRFIHAQEAPTLFSLALNEHELALSYHAEGTNLLLSIDLKNKQRTLVSKVDAAAEIILGGGHLWALSSDQISVYHRGAQLCSFSFSHHAEPQKNISCAVLSSDGASLWYAHGGVLRRLSSTGKAIEEIHLPGASSRPISLSRDEGMLAALQQREDKTLSLWSWQEGASPTTPHNIQSTARVDAFAQTAPGELCWLTQQAELYRFETASQSLTKTGGCALDNPWWPSLQGQYLFAVEQAPTLFSLDGSTLLKLAGARRSPMPYTNAQLNLKQRRFAACQDETQSILGWTFDEHSRGELWPELQIWLLPEGELLFYERDGTLTHTDDAHQYIKAQWPNGELSPLNDPRIKRWRR